MMLEITVLNQWRSRRGVYAIVNTQDGKRYVGSSKVLGQRIKAHKSALRGGRHHSRHLQHAWSKYGEQTFKFYVLIELPNATAPELGTTEQAHIDATPIGQSYNVCPVAGSVAGREVSDETRERMRVSGKTKYFSPEHRAKISRANKGNKANLGRKLSASWRKAMSDAGKEKVFTETHKANLSQAAQQRERNAQGHFKKR